jgi:hypothetical protein
MSIATTIGSSDVSPDAETGGTLAVSDKLENVTKLVVAVHGVGDQYSYATLQSVVNQFCRHYKQPVDIPLGAFHNGRSAFSVGAGELDSPLTSFGFAEVYWATIPRKLVANKHTLEEAKKWATTIIERLRARSKKAEPISYTDADFALSTQIVHEMIETIAVAERLCWIADKAGLFTFDLRKTLDDYLGDVQVVAEFGPKRRKILDTFHKTMEKASTACPNATSIYIVAHSEGTVVALLGLLEALGSQTPPSWTAHVRGFMTLGSPIDKHLYFWPELFACRPPARKPGAPIAWRNYYDRGDPIGFELDAARRWLGEAGPNGVTWRDVFEFDEDHDIGFTRYPFPGKAHVDYWEDDDVFGHFIKSVVAQSDRPDTQLTLAGTKGTTDDIAVNEAPSTTTAGSSPVKPQTRRAVQIASWTLPYVGVFALLLTAAFIMDKAVLMASGDDDTASVLEIFRGTFGLALLLSGVTVAARIPRLTTSLSTRIGAVLAGTSLVGLSLVSWGAFDSLPEDVVPVSSTTLVASSAAVILLSWFFGATRPKWGATPMILIGTSGVAATAARIVGTAGEGPTWPLIVATAAFLYLWLLGALLFDLIVAWHVYIKTSLINQMIGDITNQEKTSSRCGAEKVGLWRRSAAAVHWRLRTIRSRLIRSAGDLVARFAPR